MKNFRVFNPITILGLFVAMNLILGLFVVRDYGRSTDESHEFRTSQVALHIYTGDINDDPSENYESLGHDQYYGTASTVLISFLEKVIFPNTDHSTKVVAHYIYFIFFQAAIIGVYLLARNFLDGWLSLGVALVFGTQPLLIGHALINPKDIPILTTFLFTVVSGFSMVDNWKASEHSEKSQADTVRNDQSKKRQKRLLSIVFLSLLIFLWCSPWITKMLFQLIEYSYKTRGQSLLGNIFAYVTAHGSLEGYLSRTRTIILQSVRWISFITPFLLLCLFYFAQRFQLYGKKVNLHLLLAASILGFAVSTRVLSITAGVIVGLYALIKLKKHSVFPMIVYTMTASLVSFITWPLTWIYGFRSYIESLALYNNFPWQGLVLFEGQLFKPNELPGRYIPKLLFLQFTEPMVILTLAGLLISLYLLYKRKIDTIKLTLIFAWFFLPLFYTIVWHPTIYNNFRHFLFITPPLFVFTGIALQSISLELKHRALFWSLCIILLVPGLYAIVQTHPYEYIYYNSFIGGINGANNLFELDYWRTAYKEAMDYANANFPPGTRILIWKDNLSGKVYGKNDLIFAAHTSVPEQDYPTFDYMIIPTSQQTGHAYFAELPIIFSVDIDEVSLMVILKIQVDDQ